MTARAVVHTGPADRAGRFLDAIGAAGFEARALPAILVERVAPDAEARAAVAAAAPYALVVVTSPRAAWALETFSAVIAGAQIMAIGAATAAACAAEGAPASHTGASARRPFLDALAGTVDVAGKAVLHLRGDLATDDGLPELQGKASRVVAPIVYRTMGVEHAPAVVRDAVCGAVSVTFTSPSGVRAFGASAERAGVIDAARAMFAATLGPSTEDAARKAGYSWRGIARRPDPSALAALLLTAGV